jgi:lipoprotein-releasing system ATP-binding protein
MSDAIVKVSDIVKTFPSGAETLLILRGIGLTVGAGTTVAINGQSGSGKSTFLNILGGLDRADSGSVNVAGEEITGLSENALTSYRRDRVGFVFQFHYLLKDFTALENVMIPGYIAGMKKKGRAGKGRLPARRRKHG